MPKVNKNIPNERKVAFKKATLKAENSFDTLLLLINEAMTLRAGIEKFEEAIFSDDLLNRKDEILAAELKSR